MYSCAEVAKFIASDAYLSAGIFQKLGVRLHLMMCRHCSRYRDQLRALSARLRTDKDGPPPSEATRDRIVDRLSRRS
jgi:hypothetical protein